MTGLSMSAQARHAEAGATCFGTAFPMPSLHGELPTYVGVVNRKILYQNPFWFGIRLGCESLSAVSFDGLELLTRR